MSDCAACGRRDETHEGFKNYETWGVALMVDNDKPSSLAVRELAARAVRKGPRAPEVRDGTWTREQAVIFILADLLKDWTENQVTRPEFLRSGDGIRGQLVAAAFGRIAWDDLAEHFLSGLADSSAREHNGARRAIEAAELARKGAQS